jgi:hypothetical protein
MTESTKKENFALYLHKLSEHNQAKFKFQNFDILSEIDPSKGLIQKKLAEYFPDQFQGRLIRAQESFEKTFFGLSYLAPNQKEVKRDASFKAIIEILRPLREHSGDNNLTLGKIDCFQFLRSVLEKNIPLFNNSVHNFDYEEFVFNHFGIKRDLSGLCLPEKNIISLQCVAQVVCQLEGNQIHTIKDLVQRLLQNGGFLFDLRRKGRFQSDRIIENHVRPIFPIPPGERKGSRFRNKDSLFILVPIPNINSKSGTNFQKLQYAIACMTRILKQFNWSISRILESKFIDLMLSDPIRSHLDLIVKDWVFEAHSEKGSIFPLDP